MPVRPRAAQYPPGCVVKATLPSALSPQPMLQLTCRPGRNASAAVAAPAMISEPAGRLACAAYSRRAACTTERSGWPRMAPVEPTCTSRPSNCMRTPVAEAVEAARPGAHHRAGGGAVVRHHVLETEAEIAVARVDDLHRRRHRLEIVGGFQRGQRRVDGAARDKADFRLDARVDVAPEIDQTAILFDHGVGQVAPDQAVHAHLHHLRAAGEAELDVLEALAPFEAAGDRGVLDGVGRGRSKLPGANWEWLARLAAASSASAASARIWLASVPVQGFRGAADRAVSVALAEDGPHRAQPFDARLEHIAGRDRHHRTQRPVSSIVAGAQRRAQPGHGVGQPYRRVERIAQQAAPTPLETGSPRRSITMPQSTVSSRSSVTGRAPSTNRPDEALSATVSASRMSQSAMRLPTTSSAGSA